MAKKGRDKSIQINMDTLCDIITNVIGMLLVVALMAVIIILGKTYKVKTPFSEPATKKPVFFECREGRVIPIHYDEEFNDSFYHRIFLPYKIILVPKGEEVGESVLEIEDRRSVYFAAISKIDSTREFAYFFVRPDSFEIFRVAREMAWELEVDYGWLPKDKGESIIFSPFGQDPTLDSVQQ